MKQGEAVPVRQDRPTWLLIMHPDAFRPELLEAVERDGRWSLDDPIVLRRDWPVDESTLYRGDMVIEALYGRPRAPITRAEDEGSTWTAPPKAEGD